MATSVGSRVTRDKVFVSYSHKDKKLAEEFKTMLAPAIAKGIVNLWDDTMIKPGAKWLHEIENAIASARIAVLLVSDNFLNSAFITKKEVPPLLEAAEQAGATIFWIYVKPCLYKQTDIERYQAAHDISKALSQLTKSQRGVMWTGICERLLGPLDDLSVILGPSPVGQIRIAPSRLRHGAEHLFGREPELAALDEAWKDSSKRILTIVAWGGTGKTSLVVEWMARKAAANWPGFDNVFDWSFYSQGTREQGAASADTFIAKALEFFGDPATARSPASPWDKGARLAQLVAQHRTLLVLDGLEPLQHPPGPLAGQFKDPAILSLLKSLAQHNPGLCIVTTRESIADLAPYHDTTTPEWNLEHLNEDAGAALLHRAGATRVGAASIQPNDPELRAASREVNGHALTLRLIGSFLALTQNGDIRQRAFVHLDEADLEFKSDEHKAYGHAFKAMAAYELWFATGGEHGARQLAVLRVLSLFDGAASIDCLAALRNASAIPGLTDPLTDLNNAQWNATLKRLADSGLVTIQSHQPLLSASLSPLTTGHSPLHAHALIRQYFAKQLRNNNPEAWRTAHQLLYEYLEKSVEYQPDTIEGLQPLYQAVAHGAQAQMHEHAFKIYWERIQRCNEGYSHRKLSALNDELLVLGSFFEDAWTVPSSNLSAESQALVLGLLGARLRAIGRPDDAVDAFRRSVERYRNLPHEARWLALRLRHLVETVQPRGQLVEAEGFARESVEVADRSSDPYQQFTSRCVLGMVLHHEWKINEAKNHFECAEQILTRSDLRMTVLYSLWGFRYNELLLDLNEYPEVLLRVNQTKRYWEENRPQKDTERGLNFIGQALERLSEAKATLGVYRTRRVKPSNDLLKEFDDIDRELERAGRHDFRPFGLLAHASCLRLRKAITEAGRKVTEAWDSAQREGMVVFQAECLLECARLFLKRSRNRAFSEYVYEILPPKERGKSRSDIIELKQFIRHNYRRRERDLVRLERQFRTAGHVF